MRSVRNVWNACGLMLACLTLWGCISEDNDDCASIITLTAQAYDASGNLLTGEDCTDVTLFFYTADLCFTHKIETQVGETVEVSVPSGSSIHVVGWGNLKNGTHTCTEPQPGDHKSTCCVDLQTFTRADAYADQPNDFFRGDIDLHGNAATINHELPIYRATGQMAITVRGLKAYAGFSDDNYSVVVGDTYSTIGFDGTLSGTRVAYNPSGSFTGDEYFVDAFTLIPEEGITLYLYHNGTLIDSVSVNSDGLPIDVTAGNLTNVLVVYDTASGTLTVQLVISDWNDVYLWKDFGKKAYNNK